MLRVIFTCFSSRAMYVDISRDYSTDSFLQVLRMYSDNGSPLIRVSKELRKVIADLSAQKGIEWIFTLADAPWMNAITESLVKLVKRVLNTIVGEQDMEFSVLQTFMFEVTELLNSHRPAPDRSRRWSLLKPE